MRQRLLIAFWAAAFTLLVTGYGYVIWQTQRPQPNPYRNAEAKKEQAGEDPYQTTREWLSRDAAGYFTMWIAALTGVLCGISALQLYMFYRQWGVMRIGLADTRKAADAAVDNAKAAIKSAQTAERSMLVLERAYIRLGFPNPISADAAEWRVHIELANTGRSFATVRDILVKFIDSDKLPPQPDYSGVPRETDSILRANQPAWHVGTFPCPTKRNGQFCFGYVRYIDIFGRMWRNRFCVQIWAIPAPEGFHNFHGAGGYLWNHETQET